MIPPRFSLLGRTALVTGGSRGIGKAIARGLAEVGADVMISARSEPDLQAAAQSIGEGLDRRVLYCVADMTDRVQIGALAARALAEMGGVDILVNNAGGNEPQDLVDATDESWDRIVELNLTSCMLLSRALAPTMIHRGWGRILHLSSVMALASNPGRGSYSATKAALIGMTRAHALELGPHGITVNCLAPGPVLTDLPRSVLSDEQRKKFAELTAVKRWATTEEMVGPALLLVSDAGSFITGAVIVADGGLLCRTFD